MFGIRGRKTIYAEKPDEIKSGEWRKGGGERGMEGDGKIPLRSPSVLRNVEKYPALSFNDQFSPGDHPVLVLHSDEIHAFRQIRDLPHQGFRVIIQ